MAPHDITPPRVLGIYPYRRGFGFAVLEGSNLLDWGLARLHTQEDESFFARLWQLTGRYRIQIVASEELRNARRSETAKRRVRLLRSRARRRGMRTMALSARTVRELLVVPVDGTNDDVAARLALLFPDLTDALPPRRRFFEPEHEAMSLFRAVALAAAAVRRTAA